MAGEIVRLTSMSSCGGCAAKAGPQDVRVVTEYIKAHPSGPIGDGLVVGLDARDDAVVVRVGGTMAIVQTVDFFPPIVDDPYAYGAIAAANAMSDVFAMGGEVLWGLNILAFPATIERAVIDLILRGGADKIAEAGGFIGGGHTVYDSEPKYGMCVTGIVDPERVWRKQGARPGDSVLLTKPLGTGIIVNAARRGIARPDRVTEVTDSMMTLNMAAARALRAFEPTAVTDVSGFGLLGHALEIADQSRVRLRLDAAALPLFDGAWEYAHAGCRTSAHARTDQFVSGRVSSLREVDPDLWALLLDPQTSGGLLACVAKDAVPPLLEAFSRLKLPVWKIGCAESGDGILVTC